MRTTRSSPIRAVLRLLTFALTFTLTPLAFSQYQSTTYSLKGGWNAVYLHGDASHTTIDALFASNPEIVSVWRWNPNPTQVQFSSSTLIPTNGTPEWSVWTRGGTANTLLTLTGQAAYLVECTGANTSTYSVPIVQKVQPPRSTWVRNGANLLGFPTRLNDTYPTLSSYFATFPVAIATNTKIFKYAGGPLGPANPIQVFDPTTEQLDRNQAYWFEAAVVSNFYAPLEITPSNLDGLHYGRNGSLNTVRVRTRTAATVTLTVAPTTSASAPVGQDQITAAVPLTRRTFNTTTNAYEFAAVIGAFNTVLGPQSSVELSFGVDRVQITGATNALYASLLRFTDSGTLMDISLPVSARVTSLSGLWIGEITATNVGNLTLAKFYTCEVTRTVGTVVTTVTSQALQSAPTALGPATLPTGTGGTLTYQWKKSNQAITGATSAQLTLTESERLESGAFGTTTGRSFPLRVIMHVDDTGTARLLSQVFMGKLAVSPHNVGLATLESGLQATELASARRISAAHLPPGAVLSTADGSGSVALGQTLVRTVPLASNAPTNPYVHAYHPDHDNRNARFDAPLAESPAISRACSFTFTTSPPAGSSAQGWGSSVIGGTYSETITGLHRKPSLVTGTFELRRVSELGSITTN